MLLTRSSSSNASFIFSCGSMSLFLRCFLSRGVICFSRVASASSALPFCLQASQRSSSAIRASACPIVRTEAKCACLRGISRRCASRMYTPSRLTPSSTSASMTSWPRAFRSTRRARFTAGESIGHVARLSIAWRAFSLVMPTSPYCGESIASQSALRYIARRSRFCTWMQSSAYCAP